LVLCWAQLFLVFGAQALLVELLHHGSQVVEQQG
jgi:hypothetical protein